MEFCHIWGVYISCVDFLILVVMITSLVIWIGSEEGIQENPDEKEKWQKQLDESWITFIISSGALIVSIIVNNCFCQKYSECYQCCQEHIVHPVE